MKTLHGVVQWIRGNPILDGMPYFEDKEKAIEYATEMEEMSKLHPQFDVKYTIIKLKKR